jgi:glycosyltransferase involved in cell wall biosynthesis
MKILIISNIPTPYRCAFFSELNMQLEKNGHELLIIFSSRNEANRDWDPDKFEYNFNCIILENYTLNFFDTYLHFNFNFTKIIKSFKPTHTILAGSWNLPIIMLLTIFYKKILKITLFWSESHIFSVRNRTLLIEMLRKFLYNKFDYFLVPNTLSQNFVKIYRQNAKTFFLPNTVNQKIFSSENKITCLKYPEFKLNSEKITIIQVSQLEQRKGVFELVETFLNLPKNIQNNFNLIIIGNGSLKNKLKEKIINQDHIFLIDYINQEELSTLYKHIDFFILSSFQDPNPLSPIEAVFSKKIIFVSQFLGNTNELIPEILKSKLIFNPNEDFGYIFNNMIDIKNDKSVYNDIVQELYQNISERWDLNKVCNNLINDLISIND